MKTISVVVMAVMVISGMCLIALSAEATTVWTDWTSATVGGNASGSAGGVGVSYLGELDGFVVNGTSTDWRPYTSFTGGSVDVSPDTVGDYLRMNGSGTTLNTMSFSVPVVDPVVAIWSLGSLITNTRAYFTFVELPTLVAGGPSSDWGGSSITVDGYVVSGKEGNGVVQFTGTFSSLSWTNTYENWYAFTVGHHGASPVPEPSVILSFASGLLGLFGAKLRRSKQ